MPCETEDKEKKKIESETGLPQNHTLNGIIDRDDGYNLPRESLQNIHVIDTHDLETLLIQTDKNIFERLEKAKSYNISFKPEQVRRAMILAEQLAMIRNAFKHLKENDSKGQRDRQLSSFA